MEDAVIEYLDNLQLGEVQNTDGVKLSDDAKMLIFLNPGIINQLAAEVQDLSRPAIFVVYDRNLVKVRSTKMNYDAIRPDDQTIVIEHQATGEQPVHVTTEGIRPAEKSIMTNIDAIRNASCENLARFLASVSKCRNCLAKRELCDVNSTTCAQAWCNWLQEVEE